MQLGNSSFGHILLLNIQQALPNFSKGNIEYSRQAFVRRMKKDFCPVDPECETFDLEAPPIPSYSNRNPDPLAHRPKTADVNYWPFEAQLMNLLADGTIFSDLSNLCVCQQDAYLPFGDAKRKRERAANQQLLDAASDDTTSSDFLVDEVNSARWYRYTLEQYKRDYDFDPDYDFFCPIILTMDL